MKSAYIAFVLACFALTAGPASAYYGASLDVSAVSPNVCPCSIVSSDDMIVRITNYGSDTDTYRFSMRLPAGWTGFILPGMTLDSGETGVVNPVWVTPACGTAPGTYKVAIAAESDKSGKRFEKELELNVMACYDVRISSETAVETCESSEATVSLDIRNMGKYGETFILSASPEWASVSPSRISVDAGDNRTVSLALNPPAGVSGARDITVRAVSETSYAEAMRTVMLDIRKCYLFNATLSPARNAVCIGSDAEYYLNIDNLGSRPDNYRIITPSWISAESETIAVGSRERRSVRMTATPPDRGESRVAVTVASVNQPTMIIEAGSLVLARDCRGVAVSISPSTVSICRGESASFVAKVENTGTALAAYEIVSSSGTLERKKLVLGPGEAHNVVLDTGAAARAGTQIITVNAYDGNVSDEDSATLNVLNCHDAELKVSPAETSSCREDTLTYTMEAKNTGNYRDNYTLAYPGGQDEFALEPGETKTADTRVHADYSWNTTSRLLFSLRSAHGVFVEKEAIISVGSKDKCYSVDLSIDNGRQQIKEKMKSLSIGYGVALNLSITNMGLRPDRYAIAVEGPDWARLSTDSVYLTPLQEEAVYLYLSPPYETEERIYNIIVIADSGNALSGVEVDANVSRELRGNGTGNETAGGQIGGITGFFVSEFEGVPIEALAISSLLVVTALVLLMRFVVFK